jgi:hypothetical protein
MRIHTSHTRDAALWQLRRMNRWLVVGSVALTGVLAEAAARAFPGKTIRSGQSAKARTGSSTATAPSRPTPLVAPEENPRAESESPDDEGSAPTPEGQAAPPEAPRSEEPSGGEARSPSGEAAAPETRSEEPSGPVVSGGS